ncbi:MAG: PTS fructose transporter subunit IIA [Betaproteobacteria bacterium]|nr:PTS fructose transporter subunit IIA [Betaproteobacteria bacterium]
MVGILIIAHGNLGQSMIDCAAHVFSGRPPQLESLNIDPQADPEEQLRTAQDLVRRLDSGDGVLVISDLFGATPCNVACGVLQPGKVEGISGANLSMLIRALTYRTQPLAMVAQKALAGGTQGVRPLPTS